MNNLNIVIDQYKADEVFFQFIYQDTNTFIVKLFSYNESETNGVTLLDEITSRATKTTAELESELAQYMTPDDEIGIKRGLLSLREIEIAKDPWVPIQRKRGEAEKLISKMGDLLEPLWEEFDEKHRAFVSSFQEYDPDVFGYKDLLKEEYDHRRNDEILMSISSFINELKKRNK